MSRKINAMFIGLAALGCTVYTAFQSKGSKNNPGNEVKSYVKANVSPERFSRIEASCGNNLLAWKAAEAQIQDSLRVDSLCKKAYFEGAQMIRDSLKNAAKAVK